MVTSRALPRARGTAQALILRLPLGPLAAEH